MKFTKHATEKFGLLRTFGFTLTQDQVTGTITAPDKRKQRLADRLNEGLGWQVRAQGGS
jgi:hypothetical protein